MAPPLDRLRTGYGAAWRKAAGALQSVAPASGHWWLRAPDLPDEPLRREFGPEQGTAIDAFYVERFLKAHADDTGGEVRTDPFDDTTGLDCVVSVDRLTEAEDPPAEVAKLHAALRPGGVLLVAVPGIRQRRLAGIAEHPDLWRFTSDGLRALLRRSFDTVDVETHGTVRAAAALLYGMPVELVPPQALQPPDPDYEIVVCARAVKAA
jgi:hypothetical protein